MPLVSVHDLSPGEIPIPIYCGLDSCQTFDIDRKTEKEFGGQESLIYAFERGMQGPALEMMLRGFKVDIWERERLTRDAKVKYKACEHLLESLVAAIMPDVRLARNKNGNLTFPNSDTQLRDFFYSHLGITPLKVFQGGEEKFPMDRKVLERLENHFYARPYVNAILLMRDLDGILGVLETEIDQDWRWRCSYNIGGTSTGRWSSSKSGVGTGSNFQNITESLRKVFIADEGYEIIGIDLEQAEAREVGWFCGTILGDWSYLDMIESGDPHSYVARMCWPELPWNGDLKKDRQIAERKFYRHLSYRQAAKVLSHGSNYMGKPPNMSAETKIPLNIVAPFQARYFAAFPCITRMHQWVATELQTKGYLVNAFGRRRDFFDRAKSDETIKGAVAYLFQSATGDRLNLGLWRIWRYMGERIQILAQLHDALYFQRKLTDNRTEVVTQALDLMKVELSFEGRKFHVPGEAVAGKNWAHRYRLREDGTLDDWNPNGLDRVKL